jgi:uncharacterized protein
VHKRLQLKRLTLIVVVTVLLVWFIRVWQGSTSVIPASIIHSFLYFPDPILVATPDELGLVYEDVYVTTADGVVVHGWYLPREEAVATLYFLHGNAGNISHRLAMLERLHRGGFSVFILDYRGYGRSGGRPSEAGTYQDALAGWRWLRAREAGGVPLLLYGRSVGGAVAAWLAVQDEVDADGVVLENTFTRLRAMAGVAFPLPGIGRFMADIYPTLDHIGAIRTPLLLIHGEADEIVPVAHAHALFAAAAEPKFLFLIPHARHNDTMFVAGDAYEERLRQFVREIQDFSNP